MMAAYSHLLHGYWDDTHGDYHASMANKRRRPDLFTDGVRAVYNDMMHQAYGGDFPAGGYDFPASAILSRAFDKNSDLHVDLGPTIDYDDFDVAEDSDLAYLNMKEEFGSATTDAPFIWPSFLTRFHGMFGAALKSYSELRAVLTAYRVDILGLDNWFLDLWEVPEGFDLEYCTPKLRSTGNALWGGVSRVLKPLMTMLPATAPGITVRHHGVHRTAYGENTLVDWSRISAIAQGIAAQLLADDEFGKSKANRLDFRLAKGDLPIAPTADDVTLKFEYERKCTSFSNIHQAMSEAISMSKRMEKKALQRYEDKNIVVSEDLTINQDEVLKLISETAPKNVYDELENWEATDDYDLDILPTRTPVPSNPNPDANMMDTITTILASRVKYNSHLGMRWAHMNAVLSQLDDLGGAAKDFQLLKKAVGDMYGDYFFVVLKQMGDVGHSGRGLVWINRLAQQCGMQNRIVSAGSLVELFKRIASSVAGVKRLATILMRVARDIDNWRQKTFVLELTDRAIKHCSPGMIISGIIHKKRKYWVNRCIQNARGRRGDPNNVAHMVVSQIRGKVLRRLKFEVYNKGQIGVEKASFVDAFTETVDNFVRKRRSFNEVVRPSLVRDVPTLEMYCANVDRACRLDRNISFVKMLQHCFDYIGEFIRDIAGTFTRVLNPTAECVSVDGSECDSDEEFGLMGHEDEAIEFAEFLVGHGEDARKPVTAMGRVDANKRSQLDEFVNHPAQKKQYVRAEPPMADTIMDEATHISKLSFMQHIETPDEEEGGAWGGSEDDENDEVVGAVALVDLVSELKEDCEGLSTEILWKIATKYGRRVPLKDYQLALNEALAARAAKYDVTRPGPDPAMNDDLL